MELSYLIKPNFFEEVLSSIGYESYTQIGAKFYKLRQTLGSSNLNELFDSASSYLSKKELNRILNYHVGEIITGELFGNRDKWISNFGYWDMISFLPGDVLTKVDRASMHVALETREPFLDPEILDFSFSLPNSLKISNKGETKYLLKKLLSKYLPNEIIELSSVVLLHKFNSPQWLKHIQKSITQLSNLTPADMSILKPGEGFLWSTKASEQSITLKPIKVSTRPRVTKHGGATKQATGEH